VRRSDHWLDGQSPLHDGTPLLQRQHTEE
jgi:hypothetical protein